MLHGGGIFTVPLPAGQGTIVLESSHLGTRHMSNSASVRPSSGKPSSIVNEYYLYFPNNTVQYVDILLTSRSPGLDHP
jgi:hypothetical protein